MSGNSGNGVFLNGCRNSVPAVTNEMRRATILWTKHDVSTTCVAGRKRKDIAKSFIKQQVYRSSYSLSEIYLIQKIMDGSEILSEDMSSNNVMRGTKGIGGECVSRACYGERGYAMAWVFGDAGPAASVGLSRARGRRMWFVIHVKPGCETQAVSLLKSAPKSDGLEEVFCPMAECLCKEHGELVEKREPMLEGCVFAVAPSKWELRACMRRADGLQSMLDKQTPEFVALEDGEEGFIDLMAVPGNRTVEMSEGEVVGGRIAVLSGPLRGREGDIRRYSNRHRWAYLDTCVAGKPASARLGLRVTRNDGAHSWER